MKTKFSQELVHKSSKEENNDDLNKPKKETQEFK